MNPSSKTATLPLHLLLITWFLALHGATAQQVQSPPPAGSDTNSGIYSPSLNRLTIPGFRGPTGSYGGAFTTNNSRKGLGGLNGANSKSKEPSDNSLLRSAWSGGADSFSDRSVTSWTAGGTAFGSTSTSWVAGATGFGTPVQTGGIWRSAPPSGLPSASPLGIRTGTISSVPSLTSGSLASAPSIPSLGMAASGKHQHQSSQKSNGGLGSGLSGGIRGPFGKPKQSGGSFGRSGSRASGRSSGTSTKRGLGVSQHTGLGTLSNPLSSSSLDSNDLLDSGTTSDSDAKQH